MTAIGGSQHLSPARIIRGSEWEGLSCVDVAHVICDVENCLESWQASETTQGKMGFEDGGTGVGERVWVGLAKTICPNYVYICAHGGSYRRSYRQIRILPECCTRPVKPVLVR